MTNNFKKCSICHKYDWSSTHTCPPKYIVQVVDTKDEDFNEDNYSTVYASDESEAAVAFVKGWDSYDSEYAVANGEPITIKVCRESTFKQLLEIKDILSNNEEELLQSNLDEGDQLDLINQNIEFNADIASLQQQIKVFKVAGEWSVDYYIEDTL